MTWLKEQLQFSRMEFLGLLGIIGLGMITMVFQLFPDSEPKLYDLQLSDVLVEAGIGDNKSNNKTSKKIYSPKKENTFTGKKKQKSKSQSFDFNPNDISQDSLQLLGFKKYQAERWVKFRSAGKKYNDINDVLSIYGIDTALVTQLKQNLVFPEKETEVNTFAQSDTSFIIKPKIKEAKLKVTVEKSLRIHDLNTCTKDDLQQIKGIGPKYAARIVKFRSILGGYSDKSQLMDVYGMTDSTYWEIKNQLAILSPPDKMRVNTMTKKQMSDHYMVSYKMAKLIHAYREEHGVFIDADDFRAIKGIKEEKIEKIIPYLDFAR